MGIAQCESLISPNTKNKEMMRKRILIKGRKVHDLGYRLFLYEEASRLGIPYFDARNIKNAFEIVEVRARGDEKPISAFLEFAKTNFPPQAEVSEVIEEDYEGDIRTIESFERSFMLTQQGKFVLYGLQMLGKQDSMLGKQDIMIEKQDKMLDKHDQTISVIKEESGKTRTELISVIRDEGEKTRTAIKSCFAEEIHQLRDEMLEIRHEIAELKEKVGA